MLERRRIRVLVPYSRTLYFNDKGTQRGLTADLMREFEQHLNRKYAKQLGKRPITVVMIPTTRDEMFDEVAQGLADIAAGNLSITESRLKQVDFAYLPDLPGMNEVIATGPKSPPVSSIDDLAGKTIHVRKVVSYRETVERPEPALREGGQAADEDRRPARRAGGRRQARDAQRRPARARRRRRLEGEDLGAGAEGREDPRRPGAEEGREGRAGPSARTARCCKAEIEEFMRQARKVVVARRRARASRCRARRSSGTTRPTRS